MGLASPIFGKASFEHQGDKVSWTSQPVTSHQPSNCHPRLLLRLKSQGTRWGLLVEVEDTEANSSVHLA